MRKIFVTLMCLLFLAFASAAYGAVAVNENGTYQGEATTLDMPSDWVTFDGSTITIAPEGVLHLPLDMFIITDGSTIGAAGNGGPTVNTQPGLEIDNTFVDLVWADGETSYAQVTFKIPADYVSGGGFRVIVDTDGDTSDEAVDFEVYTNAAGNVLAWADDHVNEAHVYNSTAQAGSPGTVTLTPTNTLAANDLCTLNIWRHNGTVTPGSGTNDLEVYYVEFFYATN